MTSPLAKLGAVRAHVSVREFGYSLFLFVFELTAEMKEQRREADQTMQLQAVILCPAITRQVSPACGPLASLVLLTNEASAKSIECYQR